MIHKAVLVSLFVFESTLAVAGLPYLYFNKISVENGLSHQKVNCMLKDRRGFLWVGTDDGLNRYDGRYFTIFRNEPSDRSSVSGNMISDLLEDENGVIWIATSDGGLTAYDFRLHPSKQFKQYKNIPGDSSSIPVNIINAIIQDRSGFIWLATDGQWVVRFDKKKEQFLVLVKQGTRNAISLCLDKNNNLWVGRHGGGLLKINTSTLDFETDPRYKDLYNDLPHKTVTSLFRDRKNNIWFGSWDRILYRHTANTGVEESFQLKTGENDFSADDIVDFAEDSEGRLWMAGRYKGLTLYDPGSDKFYNYRHDAAREGTIADDRVNCVFIDSSGMVWLGTNKGISAYNPLQQPFVQTFLPGMSDSSVIYDFYTDARGRLWIGTSEGIFIRDRNSDQFTHRRVSYNSQPLTISRFFKDDDGTMYLGTNFSLFVYDERSNTCTLLPNTKKDPVIYNIIASRIVSIIKDTIGNDPVLFVSPFGHYMAYYDLKGKHWVSRVDTTKKIISAFNLRDNLIKKFYRDKSGRMWMATTKAGLGQWKKSSLPSVDYYSHNPQVGTTISNDNVFDIAEDLSKNLWISTYGGGLNFFNPRTGRFRHLALTNNLLEGLQIDDRQYIWMISNGNLQRYHPVQKTFDRFELPDLEKSGGVSGYIYKDPSGSMYVAGSNYFIAFDPRSVHPNNQVPRVHFTDLKIFNTSNSHLLNDKLISLKYNENYFTLEFSAPEFKNHNIEYSYILEGVDKDWIHSGERNFASYSNLQSGRYTFKVRASDPNIDPGGNYSSIVITIIPPFWKTWWFAAIVIMAIGLIIYAFYRYRINELLKRQAIRNRIAQDLHDNVGSTLSSISVYSQVAKIYNEQTRTNDLKDTLERISNTSGEMISEMNDIVWAINPRNDHMDVIIQRMESYARPLLQAANVGFDLKYDPSILGLNIQMEQRKNFYLIFKEAINNAMKYSGCTLVRVEVKIRHHAVELLIQDNGNGFDVSKTTAESSRSLSGNGLINMKLRATDLKGRCAITSEPGEGTKVELVFPLP